MRRRNRRFCAPPIAALSERILQSERATFGFELPSKEDGGKIGVNRSQAGAATRSRSATEIQRMTVIHKRSIFALKRLPLPGLPIFVLFCHLSPAADVLAAK